MFYQPFHHANTGRGQMTLVVRTAGDPTSVAAAVRREARTMDPAMPFGRVCRPEDVAAVVRWLVSDQAGYLTGERIYVDAGGGP